MLLISSMLSTEKKNRKCVTQWRWPFFLHKHARFLLSRHRKSNFLLGIGWLPCNTGYHNPFRWVNNTGVFCLFVCATIFHQISAKNHGPVILLLDGHGSSRWSVQALKSLVFLSHFTLPSRQRQIMLEQTSFFIRQFNKLQGCYIIKKVVSKMPHVLQSQSTLVQDRDGNFSWKQRVVICEPMGSIGSKMELATRSQK